MQNVEFDIKLTIQEAEVLLAGLMKLPKEVADAMFNKLQQVAMAAIQEANKPAEEAPKE